MTYNPNRDPFLIYPSVQRILSKDKKNHSTIKALLKNEAINEEFLKIIRQLPLEDIIAIKLEDSVSILKNRKLYNIPWYNSIKDITRDAVIKFAISATSSQREASKFLGVRTNELLRILKKYNVDIYFRELILKRKNNEI